jgi:Flp pilus assembly protein TadG
MELAILAPVVVLGFVFVVWAGRAGQSSSKVEHAADRGARAASLASRAQMPGVGQTAALAELQSNGADCTAASAAVAIHGDRVTVTVTCHVNAAGMMGLPARTVTASSTEPIDVHRGDE